MILQKNAQLGVSLVKIGCTELARCIKSEEGKADSTLCCRVGLKSAGMNTNWAVSRAAPARMEGVSSTFWSKKCRGAVSTFHRTTKSPKNTAPTTEKEGEVNKMALGQENTLGYEVHNKVENAISGDK